MALRSVLGGGVIWFTVNFLLVQGTVRHDSEVRLKEDLFKNYSKEVIPPHGNNPIIIQVALSIITIANVDPTTQELHTNAWLKMKWQDSRLKWDEANYNGIKTVRLPGRRIWQPDVSLYNSAFNHLLDLTNPDINIVLHQNGSIMFVPPLTMYTYCEFDLKFYPYDTHKCFFKFGSWTYSGEDIHFELLGNNTKVDLMNTWNKGGEWEIIDSGAMINVTKYSCCEEIYPDVTFDITIRRRSPFYRSAILCPVVATVILILISFWVSPVTHQKTALNLVAFAAMVFLLMHFSNTLPAVGGSVPLIVKTCAVLLFVAVILTGLSIFIHGFLSSRGHRGIPHWANLILNSIVSNLFCISPPAALESSNSAEDPSNLIRDEDSKLGCTLTPQQNQWICFFQLVDRISFVVFAIVMLSLLIAAAAS